MTRARSLTLVAAVLAPVAVSALLSLARGLITNNNAALVLVLVVVAVAATGDRVAGLVAAVVSAAAFDFFLTQPYLDFAISERDDIEAAVLLALIGLAVTEVALWGRASRQRRARARATSGRCGLRGPPRRLGGTSAVRGRRAGRPPDRRPPRPRRLRLRPGPSTPTGPGWRPTAPSPGGAAPSTSTGRACRRSTSSSSRGELGGASTAAATCSRRPTRCGGPTSNAARSPSRSPTRPAAALAHVEARRLDPRPR